MSTKSIGSAGHAPATDGPPAVGTAAQDWRSRNTISIEECAPIIGVSRATAYDAAHSGDIPTFRVGKRFLVPVAALRRMLGELPAESTAK